MTNYTYTDVNWDYFVHKLKRYKIFKLVINVFEKKKGYQLDK